ncbi:MAG: ABC transporter ATP-binding protein [Gammaproteobacteria bacterium]|nr:ABC transporter ATP-binding protein [Gammaproteobacteria bacterium]
MHLPSALSGRRRWIFAGLAANGLLQAAMAFLMAGLVRHVFDGYLMATQPLAAEGLWSSAFALVLVALVTAWLRLRETVDAERLGQDYVLEIRRLLMMHLTQLSVRAQGQKAGGSTFLRFVGDLTALRQWLSQGMAKLSVAGVMVPGILLILASMSPLLAGVVATVLVLAVLVARMIGNSLEDAVRTSRRRRSQLAANINEKIARMPVVQVSGRGRRERNRLFGQSERLVEAMVARARVVGTLRGLAQLTAALASASALVVGVIEVQSGQISAGSVVAAMSVVGLMVAPIRDLGRVSEYWHAANVAREKLQSTLDHGPLVRNHPDARPLTPGAGRVEFEHVAIPGVLADVSMVAEAGARVLLSGDNGSGKSALLSLLARMDDPSAGRILIDGQDTGFATLGSLRRAIGVVSPELPLLRGTLRWNLAYRNPEAAEGALQAVMQQCGVDRLLADLPEGLDTRISESSEGLSTGQRRRVMLARALLGSPRILVLDEADANVDADTLAIFERVLQQFRGTVFMVTQRAELQRHSTAVWRFAHGRVSAEATPPQLRPAIDRGVLPA